MNLFKKKKKSFYICIGISEWAECLVILYGDTIWIAAYLFIFFLTFFLLATRVEGWTSNPRRCQLFGCCINAWLCIAASFCQASASPVLNESIPKGLPVPARICVYATPSVRALGQSQSPVAGLQTVCDLISTWHPTLPRTVTRGIANLNRLSAYSKSVCPSLALSQLL